MMDAFMRAAMNRNAYGENVYEKAPMRRSRPQSTQEFGGPVGGGMNDAVDLVCVNGTWQVPLGLTDARR